jgi:type IV pilus assembly protein PilM
LLTFFKSPLGVDFGTSSLKIIHVQGKTVKVAAILDLEEHRHDPDALGRKLDAFIMGLGLRGRHAIVNTPGSHTFIRTVLFPRMPGKELKEALMWEVKRQIPYPLEDAVLDYVTTENGNQVAVTFAACEKRYAEGHIEPLRVAGLKVAAVDINPLCIMRTLKPSTAGNVVVVDIGALSTEIHIIKNEVLRITRTVGIGGDGIRKKLEHDGMSEAEAQKQLREGSQETLSAPLSEISLEIFRSIDYYKANFKESNIAEIIITGGLSINPAVKGFFADKFGLPVGVNNPFAGLKLSDESMRPLGPLFSIAMGLARRSS